MTTLSERIRKAVDDTYQKWHQAGVVPDFETFVDHVQDVNFGLTEPSLEDPELIIYAHELASLRDLLSVERSMSAESSRSPVEPPYEHSASYEDEDDRDENEERTTAPEVPRDGDPINWLDDHLGRLMSLLGTTPVLKMGMVVPEYVSFSTPAPVNLQEGQRELINAVIAPLMRIAGITGVSVTPTEMDYRTLETRPIDPADKEGRLGWIREGIRGCLILPQP